MRGSRVLPFATILPVVLVTAAVAPFVSWRKADPAPATAAVAVTALPDTISFNQHIRPIFVANCFRCHGSDPGTREAELRLVRPEFAFAPRSNGLPAIV
jgi:cytochrome c553